MKDRIGSIIAVIVTFFLIGGILVLLCGCKEDPVPPSSGVEETLELHSEQLQVLDKNISLLQDSQLSLGESMLALIQDVDSVMTAQDSKIARQNTRISALEARRDTIYMVDSQGVEELYIVSHRPLPPAPPSVNRAYVDTIVMEDDYWVYYLHGDSLEIQWEHDYLDVNGAVITQPLWFHAAYVKANGASGSISPYTNTTQEMSLVMKGLPSGELISPAVAAFIYNDEDERVYSDWIESRMYGWKVRAR